MYQRGATLQQRAPILLIESILIALSNMHPVWIAVIIAAIAFAEACPGVGLFVSGIVLLTVSTAVLANQLLMPVHIMMAALCGALLADHCGFYLGRWLGPKLEQNRFMLKHRTRLAKAEVLIARFGPLAVIAGRLIPAVRSIVPTLVGASGVKPLTFSVADLLACSVWVIGLGALNQGLNVFLA